MVARVSHGITEKPAHSHADAASGEKPTAFHSEADFQLAFGRALEQEFWDFRVRLEYRIDPSVRRRVDITIFDKKIVFELKYRTRRAQLEHLNERFSLPHQGAYPATRFEFLKDIGRIEAWRRDGKIRSGYAIF